MRRCYLEVTFFECVVDIEHGLVLTADHGLVDVKYELGKA